MPSTVLPNPDRISWQQLLTVEPKSGQFLDLAKTLLSSDKHRKFNVSRFTQKDAVQLIDVIDIGILQNETLPNNLKSVAFGILRRLCGRFRRLPRSYLIEEGLSTEGEIPFSARGATTLWKGRWSDSRVAIKMLRLGPDDNRERIAARFCKEVLLWPRLHHPNVLPVYGASMTTFPLCIVSPWMENGNILDFTRKHPEINRMNLLIDVANGLRYLHRIDQIHGNLRGANILISNDKTPRARLADFGLNVIMFDVFSMSKASVNWTAPEIFAPGDTDFKPTFASDIYALGMLVYEVLTGRSPFYKRAKAELAYQVVREDKRPLRPQDSERLGITDSVWDMMVTCWDKKVSARLQIESVIQCLTKAARVWVADVPAFLLASEAGIARVMALKGEEAQIFLDKLCKTLTSVGINSPSGKTYLTRLRAICNASGMVPTPLVLSGNLDGLGTQPVESNGSATIYKATYQGRVVAVKALKARRIQAPDDTHKRLVKEVIGWAWLRHENVLPFVGITMQSNQFSIVSEWIPNGDIVSFVAQNPGRNLFPLLIDTAVGLQYLHRNDFVHGDLRGTNILVDSDLRARLAGFGRTRIMDDDALEDQTKPSTAVERDDKIGDAGDSVRWRAPEMMNPDKFGFTRNRVAKLPSKSTDIYAFGMTILEVLTGRPPFGRASDPSIIKKVIDGIRPERPTTGFTDGLWKLLELSWSEEYENQGSKRPSIGLILEQLQKDSSWFYTAKLPFPTVEQKRSPFSTFRGSRSSTVATGATDGGSNLRPSSAYESRR